MIEFDNGRQRSKYLKTGCKECKRRKIKCDEFINPPPEAYLVINAQDKQLCWQCTRLKKECVYPLKGERVSRVSMKVLARQKLAQAADSETTDLPSTPSETLKSPRRLFQSQGNVSASPAKSSTTSHSPESIPHPQAPHSSTDNTTPRPVLAEPSTFKAYPMSYKFVDLGLGAPQNPYYRIPPDPSRNGKQTPVFPDFHRSKPDLLLKPDFIDIQNTQVYDSSDLALLASDLNNLVSDMIFEVNPEVKLSSVGDVQIGIRSKPSSAEHAYMPHKNAISPCNEYPTTNVGLGLFDVTPDERIYLQEFYLGFSSVILPFPAYDKFLQSYCNPIRDTLFNCAYIQSFLLAAILAQGARSSFLKNGLRKDELAYYKYLLECLKLLGPALGDQADKTDLSALPNIEAVLLTVLLSTSSNAANSKQNWRPHLRGAKDILLKHTVTRKSKPKSKVLLVCKYWFISFEILAGLGLTLGGVLELEAELDLLLDFSDPYEVQMLKQLGLVTSSDFYLIGGYHIGMIEPLRDLIKLLLKIKRGKNYIKNETVEYIRLLGHFGQQCDHEFVNKKALLRSGDLADLPHTEGLLLDSIISGDETITISWMDISQQMYCLAAMLTILTDFLDLKYDSPQVQATMRRTVGMVTFLRRCPDPPPVMRCTLMMIQWPMNVAGINAVREDDKQLILKFFSAALNSGAASAEHTMARMRKLWANRAAGLAGILDDNVDLVTY